MLDESLVCRLHARYETHMSQIMSRSAMFAPHFRGAPTILLRSTCIGISNFTAPSPVFLCFSSSLSSSHPAIALSNYWRETFHDSVSAVLVRNRNTIILTLTAGAAPMAPALLGERTFFIPQLESSLPRQLVKIVFLALQLF
jgi:hypothetical protein